MKLGVDDSTTLLNDLNSNAEFALLDKSSLKYYSPLNVAMPCEQLGDTFEMQLLVERTADEDVLKISYLNFMIFIMMKRSVLKLVKQYYL